MSKYIIGRGRVSPQTPALKVDSIGRSSMWKGCHQRSRGWRGGVEQNALADMVRRDAAHGCAPFGTLC